MMREFSFVAALVLLLGTNAQAQNTLFPANPGDMIVKGGAGAWVPLPGGTAGCVLTSNGPAAPATWQCALALNFQLPPTAPNRVWGNVGSVQAPGNQIDVSQFLNTIDYDVQRPPLPGSLVYKGTDNKWHALPSVAQQGWVLTAQGTGQPPDWRSPATMAPGTTVSVTANYSIQPSDCNSTVYASGSFFTLTLPATTGFTAPCVIGVKNGDTGRGKRLTGFPADFAAGVGILWPAQFGTVTLVNGAWVTTINPGIYQAAGSVTLYVSHPAPFGSGSGADSGNDCLSASTACATIERVNFLHQTVVRVGPGGQAIIQTDCNFTETPSGALIGSSNSGSGVVYLNGDAGNPNTTCRWTSAGWTVNDFGKISINGIKAFGTGGGAWVTSGKGGQLYWQNMWWASNPGGVFVKAADGGLVNRESSGSTIGDVSCAPNCMLQFLFNDGGIYKEGNQVTEVPFVLAYSQWVQATNKATTEWFKDASFNGPGAQLGSTGEPYRLSMGATLQISNVQLPGSSAPQMSSGACVATLTKTTCVPEHRSNYADLANCDATTAGAQAHVYDSVSNTPGAAIAGGGGTYHVLAWCGGAGDFWRVVVSTP